MEAAYRGCIMRENAHRDIINNLKERLKAYENIGEADTEAKAKKANLEKRLAVYKGLLELEKNSFAVIETLYEMRDKYDIEELLNANPPLNQA